MSRPELADLIDITVLVESPPATRRRRQLEFDSKARLKSSMTTRSTAKPSSSRPTVSTGAYLSAVREDDMLCLGLNAAGENAREAWCDTAAAITPEAVMEVGVAHVASVRATDGTEALVAFGATHPDVITVEVVHGASATTQRHLPFYAHAFFAVSVTAAPAELRYLDSSGAEIGRSTTNSAR